MSRNSLERENMATIIVGGVIDPTLQPPLPQTLMTKAHSF